MRRCLIRLPSILLSDVEKKMNFFKFFTKIFNIVLTSMSWRDIFVGFQP